MLAFDLGGTWFRAGLVDARGGVRLLERVPAIRRSSPDEPVRALVDRLVDFLVAGVRRHQPASPAVAVSLGATMDMNTGTVLSSAPLWGADECRIDIEGELSQRMPGVRWQVLNDVSALAEQFASQYADQSGWVAAVTISSGIAYRLIDPRTRYVPRDPRYGLQGEIGHLPTDVHWRGERLSLRCECGVDGHVSSYSSGPGILAVLRHALRAEAGPADLNSAFPDGPDAILIERWTAATKRGEPPALEVLDTVTRPIALVLLYQATLNPEVSRTVVTGGVVGGLGRHYLDSLLRNLRRLGLYRVTDRDPDYFRDRIVIGTSDGLDALRGATQYARRSVAGEGRP